MDSSNPLEQIYQLVAPYLPSSIASPLHQLLAFPSSALSNPTQLISLAVSLLALYAAILSLWSTARSALRLGWFFTKWGAILSGLRVAWSGYQGVGTEQGSTQGLRTLANVGGKAFAIGSQGVQWWMGGNNAANGAKGKRSASGRPRTWARTNDDGGWDDPAEVDDGVAGQGGDVLKSVQDAVLTFLANPGDPNGGKSGKGSKKKPTKKQQQQQAGAPDLGSMATDFALNKAKKAWNEFTGL